MTLTAVAKNKLKSSEVLLTSQQGDKIATKANINFTDGKGSGNAIEIKPDLTKQTLFGIGTSFSESSAFVLAHLNPDKRAQLMADIFSHQGANFSLARTPIGSCDFCLKGCYSYDDIPADVALKHFSIGVDKDGFNQKVYPGIRDENFDLLPMIKEAQAIKAQQADSDLRIIASPWSAPAWMKDINAWYITGSGGQLKYEYQSTFADYLLKYLYAYRQEGVNIWGLTPVNEPLGNYGQWESMHFNPKSQNIFIKNYLGPKLKQSNFEQIKLLIYDHSRDQLEQWADVIYNDRQSAQYVDGAAVHFYESTFKVFEDVFERVHAKYPQHIIIHSEGCIDSLGLNKEHLKEYVWFDNDDFWWNDNATDWAYLANWQGVNADDHPIYTPVHRYARNIIVSLDHWVGGWIDWNVVLDKRGGPNHVANYCAAPIMIDLSSNYIYYTPIFYILAQFSKTIRPGDKAVQVDKYLEKRLYKNLYISASISDERLLSIQILNTAKCDSVFSLQIYQQYAKVKAYANSLQTIRIQL